MSKAAIMRKAKKEKLVFSSIKQTKVRESWKKHFVQEMIAGSALLTCNIVFQTELWFRKPFKLPQC